MNPRADAPKSFLCNQATGDTPAVTLCGLPLSHGGDCVPLSRVMPQKRYDPSELDSMRSWRESLGEDAKGYSGYYVSREHFEMWLAINRRAADALAFSASVRLPIGTAGP